MRLLLSVEGVAIVGLTGPVCRDEVVLVPGIMGSELVEAGSGDLLWGLAPSAYAKLLATDAGMRRLRLTDDERAGRVGRVRATGLLRFPAGWPGRWAR